MKTVLSTLIMLLCLGSAHAFDRERIKAYEYKEIPYISVDTDNKPVLLSESIFYPTVSNDDHTPDIVKFIVLNNHPTVTTNAGAPTGSAPIDASMLSPHGSMALMASERALVISPDYLGYGYSSNHIHPYCNHALTAKNVIDGYLAAIDTIKAMGIVIDNDYYSIITGYSQGGSVTMAVQKYLETEASQEVNDIVRLRHSYCGAGPYDLALTYQALATCDGLSFSCSIPMTIEGLKAAYREGCMKMVDLDSVYTSKEFREGIHEVIASKEMGTTEISNWISNFFGKENVNAADMLRPEILRNSNAAAHAINKALSKCNLLDGTWIPKAPITLFHFTGDDVVPFVNSEEAVKMFGDKVRLYTEKDSLRCNHFYMSLMLNTLQPNPKDHVDYGTVYTLYFIDGVLREEW